MVKNRKRKAPPHYDPFSPTASAASAATASTVSVASVSTTQDKVFHQNTFKMHSPYDPLADARLTAALVDFTQVMGLPDTIPSCPKMGKVLDLAKKCSKDYKPPGRNEVGGKYLEQNFACYREKIVASLLTDADTFGIAMYADGATVKRAPLINILGSGVHNNAAILEIKDCSEHAATGGKKDAKYVAQALMEHVEQLQKEAPNSVDLVIFDGAANVQKAGLIMQRKYPKISVIKGGEHVIALMFKDLFTKVPAFRALKHFNHRLYDLFGGGRHIPFSVFTTEATKMNYGKRLGLIMAAETRMAGEAISLLRSLRLKRALKATIHSHAFTQAKCAEVRNFCCCELLHRNSPCLCVSASNR